MSKSAQSDTPTEGATSVDVLCAQLEFVCSPIHTIHEERQETCDKVTAKLRTLERELAERDSIIRGLSDLLRKEGEELATTVAHANGLTDLVRRLEAKLAEAHKDAERYLKLSIELEAVLAAGGRDES